MSRIFSASQQLEHHVMKYLVQYESVFGIEIAGAESMQNNGSESGLWICYFLYYKILQNLI